jgi:signal transduction histidine kinase
MRLTFRTKLMVIVGISAVAFGLLVTASAALATRVEGKLSVIQQDYLPRLELQPQLEGSFERLRRDFQDAVSAHDGDALAATGDERASFLEQLAAAHDGVSQADAAALRAAFEDYYAAGFDVSRRLIADETGEALVDAMSAMQAKQNRVSQAIVRSTAFDRHQLTDAFAAAAQAERTAKAARLWIAVGCLVSVVLLSMAISRGVLRSLADLTDGFARFGRGQFGEPIRVMSGDEIGDVARQANEMAASLDRLGKETRNAEEALKLSNRELEAFSYSVAHDLRAPLRGINGFSQALLEDYGDRLEGDAKDYLNRIGAASERMGQLIDALLSLSRVSRAPLERESVNLSRIADAVTRQLQSTQPERVVELVLQEGVTAYGDPRLLRALLENLLGNAWKFTGNKAGARIAFGAAHKDGEPVFYVEDNGAGFDIAYADKLFAPFQRLHDASKYAGTGIGLATVQRIVRRHGGRIWAESAVDRGATFHFTLADASRGDIA